MKICLYEGYIRNRRALMEELSVRPGNDRHETETAILESACRRWGAAAGDHIRGAFAFAALDEESGGLLCARDPFGIQTFYYCLTEGGDLLYGTDLASVVSDPRYEKAICRDALQLYLAFGYPVGDTTLYRGVRKLKPGHCLTFRDGALRTFPYYYPAFCPDSLRTEEEWAAAIDGTLQAVIAEDRDNFDLSSALSFLSGGVDSSYLLASSGAAAACGIGYAERGAGESALAARTAAALGRSFREIIVTPERFFDAVPRAVRAAELPLADASAAAFFIGCEEAAKTTSLCFSGEGADEFFAGYHVYGRADELGSPDGQRYYGCDGVMEQETARRLLGMDHTSPRAQLTDDLYDRAAGYDALSRMLAVDISLWLEGDILFGAGRNARANGLSLLLPYADRRMFELAAAIPSSLKRKDGVGKYIFRKAARTRIPEETAYRRKVGFSVPVRTWMRGEEHRDAIEEALFGDTAAMFFDRKMLRGEWTNCINGVSDSWRMFYAVLVFVTWYETCYSAV